MNIFNFDMIMILSLRVRGYWLFIFWGLFQKRKSCEACEGNTKYGGEEDNGPQGQVSIRTKEGQ